MIEDTTPQMRETMAHEDTDNANRESLFRLIAQYDLHINRRDLDRWRPTIPTQGTIDGFFDLGTMTCVATDGIQAWFLLIDQRPHIGHVQFFHWDNPVVTMVPYLKPSGEVGYFKSVKDQGAPGPLHKRPREHKPRPITKKKKVLSKRKQILDTL